MSNGENFYFLSLFLQQVFFIDSIIAYLNEMLGLDYF